MAATVVFTFCLCRGIVGSQQKSVIHWNGKGLKRSHRIFERKKFKRASFGISSSDLIWNKWLAGAVFLSWGQLPCDSSLYLQAYPSNAPLVVADFASRVSFLWRTVCLVKFPCWTHDQVIKVWFGSRVKQIKWLLKIVFGEAITACFLF